ncbi:DUF3015 family protein [Pseudobacteriovorax antillogorgiicola]|uniref:Uncharacterized protein n=1 Tax=Pseudobacteriovorax antillogorgiicola TaxID=1513793 RepID=A0A1Y6BT01_9BACT|nr:DUF3015 family protein [Pseudobacteriovorax antillogorgiicola]TCS52972.1 DUF3015 family protein [Pseudobacteriovorax antillogorgiicola]SMF27436.1 Protein of unknown function [Pseudobacteriovorax antillogorgiicola]
MQILYCLLVLVFFTGPQAFGQSYPLMRVLQKDMPQNAVFGFIPACGIGSYLLPTYSWLSSAPASTTNMAFSSVAPTSTTMNMSECKGPKTLVENQPDIYKFAERNLEKLAQDMARGEGESLDALASLMKIPEADQDRWRAVLKREFAFIFPAPQVSPRYVLDQVTTISFNHDIVSPYARNFSWNDLFQTY